MNGEPVPEATLESTLEANKMAADLNLTMGKILFKELTGKDSPRIHREGKDRTGVARNRIEY